MPGMIELGEEVFHMPVRLGAPQYVKGLAEVILNPRYSTGVGLLLDGYHQYQRRNNDRMRNGSFFQAFGRMKNWLEVNF